MTDRSLTDQGAITQGGVIHFGVTDEVAECIIPGGELPSRKRHERGSVALGHCPDCGGREWLAPPKAVLLQCGSCYASFNVEDLR